MNGGGGVGPVGYPLGDTSGRQVSRSEATRDAICGGTVGGPPVSSTRLGRRGRARLSDELSARDMAVLTDVGRFRLMTSRQLQVLHFANSATTLTAARITRRVLSRLVECKLLQRMERQVGGLYGGSAAFAYALTTTGQRLLEEHNQQSTRRLREPSRLFVRHRLAITELYSELVEQVRCAPDAALLEVQTEPDCWRRWTRPAGAGEVLRPDLYVALAAQADELRWFVEVDLSSEHRPALARKCWAYQRYLESGREQLDSGVFPQVLWVAPDERRAVEISGVIRSERGLTDGLFAVTTAGAAAERLRQ